MHNKNVFIHRRQAFNLESLVVFYCPERRKTMSKKKNREPPQKWESITDHERFVRIFASMIESLAFKVLSPVATKMLLILKNEYRGNYTMNNIICPYSTFENNGISRNSISPD